MTEHELSGRHETQSNLDLPSPALYNTTHHDYERPGEEERLERHGRRSLNLARLEGKGGRYTYLWPYPDVSYVICPVYK